MISEVTLNTLSHASDHGGSIEHWAMNRAHQIVVHEGMRLVEAAQSLNRKQTSANTYALRAAIMECLIEAMREGPHPMAAE
jgi:hypothetical protein